MIRVRSAVVMVSGVVLLLAVVVTAWAGSKHGKPNPSDDGPFGGTVPSAEEFATYPKTLPPGAFAARLKPAVPAEPVHHSGHGPAARGGARHAGESGQPGV